MNDFIADMQANAVLPKDEIQRRFACGEISRRYMTELWTADSPKTLADRLEMATPKGTAC